MNECSYSKIIDIFKIKYGKMINLQIKKIETFKTNF